jgi:hypothetical protein
MSELRAQNIDVGPSPRIFPNIILTNVLEKETHGPSDWRARILRLADEGRDEVLRSQFIDVKALEFLRERATAGFLRRRAEVMREKAFELVGN